MHVKEPCTPGQIAHYMINAIPGIGHVSMIITAVVFREDDKRVLEIGSNNDYSIDSVKFMRNMRNLHISSAVREFATIAILVTLAALSIISPVVPIVVGVIGLIIAALNILSTVGLNTYFASELLTQQE